MVFPYQPSEKLNKFAVSNKTGSLHRMQKGPEDICKMLCCDSGKRAEFAYWTTIYYVELLVSDDSESESEYVLSGTLMQLPKSLA